MMFLIWAAALVQMIILIYAPCVALYGIMRISVSEDVENTIRNPFFGLKTLSMKWGLAVWTMQWMLLGSVIYDLAAFQIRGCRPIIFSLL